MGATLGEQANLKRICDEIFGDDNSLESIIWKKRYQGAKEKHLIGVHEYILVYAKLKNNIGDINVPCTQEHIDKYYTNKDENFNSRGGYRTQPLEAGKSMDVRGNLRFTFQAPDGQIISPKRQWIWSQERVESAMALGEIGFTKGNQGELTPYIKQYLKDRNGVIRKTKKQTIIANVYTQNGTKEMDTIFNNTGVFSFPKPTNLLTQLIEISDDNTEQIILDFFSGSATSAHAVMKINAEDGGNRKFIMVQLPEVCAVTSEAYKEGYKTIAEIGKERIRRAGNKLKTDNLPDLDIGFRVLKVDSSNMKDVYYTPDKLMQGDLEQFTDNIRDDSTPEDLLFQVLLDWGVDLTLPITQEIIAGFNVLFVDDNALAACFDTDINEAFVKELAARHPMRVVFRDAGFASDSVKINIEQIFKLISPATEIKTL
jgi:adenine-specific DNA-methyltransferase